MSTGEGDIIISIGIELTSKSKETIATLTNLHKVMADMGKINIQATKTFKEVSGGVINFGDQMITSNTILKSFLTNIGALNIDLDQMGEDATKVRKAMSGYNTAMAASRMILDQFGRSIGQVAWAPTSEGITDISNALDGLRGSGPLALDVVKQIQRGFARAGVNIPVQRIKDMDEALGRNSHALMIWANTYVESLSKVDQRLKAVSDMNRVVTATMGPMGVAVMDAANTFFWFGLGSMFTVMSLMRLNRAVLMIKSSNLSLVRASVRLVEAQETLNKYQQAGISIGKAYGQAVLSVRDATLAQELAEDRLKQAVQNRMFSYMQLIFGTFPTLIRAGTSILMVSIKLAAASAVKTNLTWQETIATVILTEAELAHANVIEMVNAKMRTYIILTGMATFGLTALIGVVGAFIAKGAIDKQMAAANKEFAEMKKLIVEPGSPPLFEAFKVMGDNVGYLTRKMKDLRSVTNVASGLRMAANKAPVYVSVTGPFYIRDRSDMNAMGDVLVRKIRSRGTNLG